MSGSAVPWPRRCWRRLRKRPPHDVNSGDAADLPGGAVRAVAADPDARRGGGAVSALVADRLSHWFGSEPALDSVDLAVDRGDHVAILGENGAGKTTLLRILDEPDASLDAEGSELLVRVMKDRTTVLATHDQALATRLCQRTVVLRKGRVLGAGSRLRVVQ